MKRYYLFAIAILFATALQAETEAQTPKQLWESANAAYISENYQEAVKDYESIRTLGYESGQLYLNLGNAYFKRGMIGKAIVNYNRALNLSPSDEDAHYNLEIANTYVQDKIDVVPTFFVYRWMTELRSCLTSNGWAWVSLICFSLMLAALLLYLLGRGIKWRKTGFYGVLGMLAIFVVTIIFAGIQRKAMMHPNGAIVMSNAAPVKSSPDRSSKDIFVLHEGTKVTVKDSLGDFREIIISDGNKGWIEVSSIEMID